MYKIFNQKSDGFNKITVYSGNSVMSYILKIMKTNKMDLINSREALHSYLQYLNKISTYESFSSIFDEYN